MSGLTSFPYSYPFLPLKLCLTLSDPLLTALDALLAPSAIASLFLQEMKQQIIEMTMMIAASPPAPTAKPKKVTSKSPIVKAYLSYHFPSGTTSLSQLVASFPASEAFSVAVGLLASCSAVGVPENHFALILNLPM